MTANCPHCGHALPDDDVPHLVSFSEGKTLLSVGQSANGLPALIISPPGVVGDIPRAPNGWGYVGQAIEVGSDSTIIEIPSPIVAQFFMQALVKLCLIADQRAKVRQQ